MELKSYTLLTKQGCPASAHSAGMQIASKVLHDADEHNRCPGLQNCTLRQSNKVLQCIGPVLRLAACTLIVACTVIALRKASVEKIFIVDV